MNPRALPALVILLLGLAGSVRAQPQTQSVPNGWLNTDATGATAWPVNQATDHRWQWHYDSSQFVVQGPITITEISLRASTATATVAAFSFPSFVVTLSSSPTDYSVAGNGTQPGHSPTFAVNVGTDATVVRTGPWSGGPVPPSGMAAATWIPLGLTTPFVYDASLGLDFLLEIEKCGGGVVWGASLDGPSGGAGTVLGNRYGVNNSCTATTSTLQNNEFVPVLKIDFVVGAVGAQYQVNQPGASLDINGILGTVSAPAAWNVMVGQSGLATLASTNTGAPWEVGLGFLPLVPASSGGTTLPDGQILNLNLSDPALTLLWNGFQSPPFVNFQVPITLNAPGTYAFQMAVLAPASPTGVHLSQPVQATAF